MTNRQKVERDRRGRICISLQKKTENPKIRNKYLKTIESEDTSETRKTFKVRPYAIHTVNIQP